MRQLGPPACCSLLIAGLPLPWLPGQLHCSSWQPSKGDLPLCLAPTLPGALPHLAFSAQRPAVYPAGRLFIYFFLLALIGVVAVGNKRPGL